MDLVRDVFGDSDSDSDSDSAADARCARETYGRPPVSFLAAAGRWRRTLPLGDVARGAVRLLPISYDPVRVVHAVP
jgi:hypothetical protein